MIWVMTKCFVGLTKRWMFLNLTRSSHRRCSSLKFGKIHRKKPVLVSFFIKLRLEACNFIEKEALAQVLSCKFCEISKNTFFTEHLRTNAFAWQIINSVVQEVNHKKHLSCNFVLCISTKISVSQHQWYLCVPFFFFYSCFVSFVCCFVFCLLFHFFQAYNFFLLHFTIKRPSGGVRREGGGVSSVFPKIWFLTVNIIWYYFFSRKLHWNSLSF